MIPQGQQLRVSGPHDFTLHECEFKEGMLLAQLEVKADPETLRKFARKSGEGGIICNISNAKENGFLSNICRLPKDKNLLQTTEIFKNIAHEAQRKPL